MFGNPLHNGLLLQGNVAPSPSVYRTTQDTSGSWPWSSSWLWQEQIVLGLLFTFDFHVTNFE